MTGHHDPTDRQGQHNRDQKQVSYRPQYAGSGIMPTKQISVPRKIQYMVQDKKQEHKNTHPFMHSLPN